jgi:transposase
LRKRQSFWGQNGPCRTILHSPAFAPYNPDLKTKYEALRAAGKPAKVAIVAIMRKLIETANSLVKADRVWVPKTS